MVEKNSNLLKEMDRRRNELLKYYSLLIEDKIKIKTKESRENYVNRLFIKETSNITYTVHKKITKRKNVFSLDSDSDVLIKNYIKSKSKYEKNTVYYRIMTSIKLTKMNKSKQKTRDNDDDDDNLIDNEIMDLEEESNIDITEDNYSVNLDIDEIEDDNPYDDNFKQDKLKPDKLLDNDDIEELEDDLDDLDDQMSSEKKTESNFLYYKKLLNNKGFIFDENKNVMLQQEDYII